MLDSFDAPFEVIMFGRIKDECALVYQPLSMPIFELMHYQTEGHLTVVQGRLKDETVWLSQKQLAELLQSESAIR